MEWLQKTIEVFRSEYSKLNDEEKQETKLFGDYLPPCQMELFWLNEPLQYQIVVVTHEVARPDKEIIVNGPYRGPEFLKETEKIMQEKRWTEKINQPMSEKDATFQDVFGFILKNYLDLIKNFVLLETKPTPLQTTWKLDKIWCWLVKGSVTEINSNEMIKQNILDAKKRVESKKQNKENQQVVQSSQLPPNGFGAYFFPSVWVGDLPNNTFSHKVSGNDFYFGKKIIDIVAHEQQVICNSDGFVGVLGDNKKKTQEILNTIFAISVISDVPCFSVRENEMAQLRIDEKSRTISSTLMEISSLRNMQSPGMKLPFRAQIARKIGKSKLEEIIQKALKISGDIETKEYLQFFLESYTYYSNSEYNQSFISGWIVIEKYAFSIWEKFLGEKSITGERRRKLVNSPFWTIATVVETLNMAEKFSKEEYDSIMQLKKIRDKFIHEGKAIEKEACEKLLDLTKLIVDTKLQNSEEA